ncbi:EF-hand domain-containing protein [Acinetobacter sp. C26M]|uniref:EF-hand domain-containing protein n=1 Tax=unclassified Acinetobacter TaxID=196816 RepID=UPI0020373213|nr:MULTISPECIES: EF-hand domain-containing protein [unclassified Acinetobacter]USA46137.1 EF-hand domain-containing protein [Acinetobacter sp. C26M]USA49621.1 EF-hand domain-containing protein [Acinetobacter sp. C26G]
MRHIQQAILSLICCMVIPIAYSCEPAGLDWEKLYADYDLNRDQMIDQNEWKKLILLQGQPVTWQKQVLTIDSKRIKIFKALDLNHNGLIDQQEMINIYQYFTNPCQGWGSTWGK